MRFFGRRLNWSATATSAPSNESKSVWARAMQSRWAMPRSAPCPNGLDYDLWCGPAPVLPYMRARHHRWWRGNRAYGGGVLMDWIGHHNDIAHWALDMDHAGPSRVEAVGWTWPQTDIYNTPVDYEIHCEYPGAIESVISTKVQGGTKWIGERGWLWVNRGKIKASDNRWLAADFARGPWKGYVSSGHVHNFLIAFPIARGVHLSGGNRASFSHARTPRLRVAGRRPAPSLGRGQGRNRRGHRGAGDAHGDALSQAMADLNYTPKNLRIARRSVSSLARASGNRLFSIGFLLPRSTIPASSSCPRRRPGRHSPVRLVPAAPVFCREYHADAWRRCGSNAW